MHLMALMFITVLLSAKLVAASVAEIRLRAEDTAVAKNAFANDYVALSQIASGNSPEAADATALLAFLVRSGRHQVLPDQFMTLRARLAQFALKSDGSWNYSCTICCLEYARLLGAEDYTRVSQIFDHVGKSDDPLNQILAGEAAGDVLLVLKQHKKAIHYYSFAEHLFASNEYARMEKRAEYAMERIKHNKRAAERVLDIENYGEAFVLYRDAEKARLVRKNYNDAIAKYNDLISKYGNTIFADAARLYACYCRVILHQIPEATNQLRAFIQVEPNGNYRGEANLLLGRIFLEKKLDIPAASKCFGDTIRWCDEAGRLAATKQLMLNPQAAIKAKPPKAEHGLNDFGFIEKTEIKPGQLFNEVSCDWYLTWLKKEAVIAGGFEYVLRRDYIGGATHFMELINLDEEVRHMEEHHAANYMQHLLVATKFGWTRCNEKEMFGLEGKKRLALQIADYYYQARFLDRARAIYQDVLDGKHGRPNFYEQAYIAAGLGSVVYYNGGYEQAAKYAAPFRDKFKKSPMAAQALFNLGQALQGQARNSYYKDMSFWKPMLEAYRFSVERGGDTHYGAYSRLRIADEMSRNKETMNAGIDALREVAARYEKCSDYTIKQFSDFAKLYLEDIRDGTDPTRTVPLWQGVTK
ncbi:MAG: hypothetical protein V1899_01935 [Planctomycetota bacterium]